MCKTLQNSYNESRPFDEFDQRLNGNIKTIDINPYHNLLNVYKLNTLFNKPIIIFVMLVVIRGIICLHNVLVMLNESSLKRISSMALDPKNFVFDDISKHNKTKDFWLIIDAKVKSF
nr:cytochrome b5 [Tanacetum cinerariifolium]